MSELALKLHSSSSTRTSTRSKRTPVPSTGNLPTSANVLSTVTPALLKNDLVLTQTFLEDSLVTTLRHVSGEEISSCLQAHP